MGPSNYYRPVFGWAYSLVARGFGLQPAAFHATSVALHLAVTLLVALGARRLFPDRRGEIAALAAGLLFAVYPAHAEAVAWIGDQVDLLTALFVLLALFSYLVASRTAADGRGGPDRSPTSSPASPRSRGRRCSWCSAPSRFPNGGARVRSGRPCAAPRRGSRPISRCSPSTSPCASMPSGSFSPRSYGVTASPAGAVAFAAGLLARYLAFLAVPFPARVLASVPAPTLLSPVAIAGLAAAAASRFWGSRRPPGAAGRGGRSSCRSP